MPQQQPRRPTRLIAAGAGVAALVLGLGLVLVLRGGGGDGGPPGAGGVVEPAGPPARDVPVLTRTTAKWMEVEGIKLPVLEGGGPTRIEGGRASGFAQTPSGAALAAMHIATRVGPELGPRVYRPTIAEQTTGVDKDRLLAKIERDYNAARAGGVTPGGGLVANLSRARATESALVGYRVDGFDPSQVGVQILSRYRPAQGGLVYFSFGVMVRWVDGDWRMVAPLNGDLQNSANVVPGVPPGFTVFRDDV